MDDGTDWLVEAARAWRDAVDNAAARSLDERVHALFAALAGLQLAALQLPDAPADAPRPRAEPPPDWPGLGSFDAYAAVVDHTVTERVLSDDLLAIHAEVAGALALLDRDPAGALAAWAAGFEEGWGPLAALASAPLHAAVRAFRADRRRQVRRGPRVPEIVRLAPPPPDVQPFVGVQLAEAGGGIEVVGVHPEGPAAGRLAPGDLLLTVGDEPLGGLALDEVRERLVGEIGERRILEVYRGEDTVRVELVIGARATPPEGPGPAAPPPPRAPSPSPEADGRTVSVRVLHEEGATRSSVALRVLGCRITRAGDRMRVAAPASLADDDLRALLDAGHRAGIWEPG